MTKSELRAYAKKYNLSMAEAKEKSKQEATEAQPELTNGIITKIGIGLLKVLGPIWNDPQNNKDLTSQMMKDARIVTGGMDIVKAFVQKGKIDFGGVMTLWKEVDRNLPLMTGPLLAAALDIPFEFRGPGSEIANRGLDNVGTVKLTSEQALCYAYPGITDENLATAIKQLDDYSMGMKVGDSVRFTDDIGVTKHADGWEIIRSE